MPEPRTRILIITRNLPPLVGGMERLNWHMAAELAKVAEVRVIGPEGSAALAPHGVQVREAPLRPLWKFLVRARALARGEARTWQPRIVLAGSGLTAPLARAAARLCGAKTAVYVHGLDIAVRNIAYRALWLPAIRRMDRVIANSRATADLCRGIGMDPARVGIVHPGVDLPRNDAYLFRNEEGRAAGGASLPPLQEESRGGDGILGIDTPKRPEPSLSLPLPAEGGSPPLEGEDAHPLRNEGGRAARGASLPPLEGEGRGGDGVLGIDALKRPGPSPSLPLPAEGGSPSFAENSSSSSRRKPGSSGVERRDAHAVSGTASFRERNDLADRRLLLSVGRLSARKGLREFVALCLPRIVASQPDAMLLIVGDAPSHALHAEAQTPESIQAAADAAGVGKYIRFLGKLPEDELLAAYQSADVHVFPIRQIPGDPEGFGMVAVEAAAHGLPTVAFATGGVVDAVAEGQSGYLVASGDYNDFATAVLKALVSRDSLRASCIAFSQSFAWPAFGVQITAQLRHIAALPPVNGGAAQIPTLR